MFLKNPIKISEQCWPDDAMPLVSICCATYNQEKYIKDAIEGFVKQETTFPVEIIIRDDASSDRNVEIIKSYEKKYPKIIRGIYNKENEFRKGVRAFQVWQNVARGKYIAVCDGDDFWVDHNKIEIQAQYLEKNPNTAISCHNAIVINEHGDLISGSKLPEKYKCDMSADEMKIIKASILSLTMMFRKVPIFEAHEMSMVISSDTFFVSLMSKYGGSHYHKDIKPACYRVHSQGVWGGGTSEEQKEILLLTWYWLYRYYKRAGDNVSSNIFRKRYRRAALKMFSTKEIVKYLIERIKINK